MDTTASANTNNNTSNNTAMAPLPEGVAVVADKKGPGILLRTLKPGDDSSFPQKGDLCLIHFDGYLEQDGSLIASTRQRPDGRPQPLQFELGAQQILEGLDLAVQCLCQGQQVEVVIPSLYAYGHQGFPPKVPPRATLIFHVELLEIKKTASQKEK